MLVYFASATLIVAVVGMAVVGIFKAVLDCLHAYAVTGLSDRIEILLASYGFERVLRLPLRFFETTPASQIVNRLREVEALRKFLTGAAVASCFDLMLSALLLGVLASYSIELTIVPLAFSGLHILVSRLFLMRSRQLAGQRTRRNATNQQFLIESIVGIATLKAAAVEPIRRAQAVSTIRTGRYTWTEAHEDRARESDPGGGGFN